MNRAPKLNLVLICSLLFASGCGAAIERQMVENEFRQINGCRPENYRIEGDTMVVRGCGATTVYNCESSTDSFLWDTLVFGKNCSHVSTSRPQPVRRQRRQSKTPPTVQIVTSDTGEKQLRVTVLTGKATLVAGITYKNNSTRSGIVYRTRQRSEDPTDQCSIRLWADGEPIKMRNTAVSGERGVWEYRVYTDLSALERMGSGDRVIGEACGHRFELNDRMRGALKTLVIRSREEETRQDG